MKINFKLCALIFATYLRRCRSLLQINYKNMIQKRSKSYINKISSYNLPCIFCKGSGFVECRLCNTGCWRCHNTKMQECIYCNGSGKGRLGLLPIK